MIDLSIKLTDFQNLYENLSINNWQIQKLEKFLTILKKDKRYNEFVGKFKIYQKLNSSDENKLLTDFITECIKENEKPIFDWICDLIFIYDKSPYSFLFPDNQNEFAEFTIFGKCEIEGENSTIIYTDYSRQELLQSIKLNFLKNLNGNLRSNILKSNLKEKIEKLKDLEKIESISLFQLENKISEILELQVFLLDSNYSIDNKEYNKNFLKAFLANKKISIPNII